MNLEAPLRRRLQIYALDPMRLEGPGRQLVTPRVTISVPYEALAPGPQGTRFKVIDYDGARDVLYDPIDLDDPWLLGRDGYTPDETDPHFHQQMTYAVVASVWEAFELAAGRRIRPEGGQLEICPHAFMGDNAFYDPTKHRLLFGYFFADQNEPGANLPGQPVFTCLSHDIIVHETTHAFLHRMRRCFNEDTNPDVGAFHEGFADLIAIFQHFKIRQVLVDAISSSSGDVTNAKAISGLARQFGFSTGQGAALRDASDELPDPKRYKSTTEVHDRGLILVQAVFDAFTSMYTAQIQDLLRISTGGSGILPKGALHPDLVGRLADEATSIAHRFFQALVRSIDYLPPVDVTFSDFLRALVTVDQELSSDDDAFRTVIIEAFRRRGIYASEAGSLGSSAVAWPRDQTKIEKLPFPHEEVLRTATNFDAENFSDRASESQKSAEQGKSAVKLQAWAKRNAAFLRLDSGKDSPKINLDGFHANVRVGPDSRTRIEVVAQFIQTQKQQGDVVTRAGTTVIGDANGNVLYVLTKPLPFAGAKEAETNEIGEHRLAAILASSLRIDREQPAALYDGRTSKLAINFAGMCGSSRAQLAPEPEASAEKRFIGMKETP